MRVRSSLLGVMGNRRMLIVASLVVLLLGFSAVYHPAQSAQRSGEPSPFKLSTSWVSGKRFTFDLSSVVYFEIPKGHEADNDLVYVMFKQIAGPRGQYIELEGEEAKAFVSWFTRQARPVTKLSD